MTFAKNKTKMRMRRKAWRPLRFANVLPSPRWIKNDN